MIFRDTGVRAYNLENGCVACPVLWAAMWEFSQVYEDTLRFLGVSLPNHNGLIITSLNDGQHSGPGVVDPKAISDHFKGEAFDARAHDLDTPTAQAVVAAAKAKLGDEFYIIHEFAGMPSAHFHVSHRHV